MILKLILLLTLPKIGLILCDTNNSDVKVTVRPQNQCKTKCVSKCCPKGMIYLRTLRIVAEKSKMVGICVPLEQNDTDLVLGTKNKIYDKHFEIGELDFGVEFTVLSGINCGEKPKHYYRLKAPFYIQQVSFLGRFSSFLPFRLLFYLGSAQFEFFSSILGHYFVISIL